MVLVIDHRVEDDRGHAQVVVGDLHILQCQRLAILLLLASQTAHYLRYDQPCGIEYGTLAQEVAHVVAVFLTLLGTLLAQRIDVVHQTVYLQFAFQRLEVVAPLLQRQFTLVVADHRPAANHLVLLRRHAEHGNSGAQTVVDVSERNLLGQRQRRTRHHVVPVDGYQLVHGVVVGIVHTAALVVECLQLQVVLANPRATALCRDARVQLRVEGVQVQGHHLAAYHLFGVHATTVEDGVRRAAGDVANHALGTSQRVALLGFRRC